MSNINDYINNDDEWISNKQLDVFIGKTSIGKRLIEEISNQQDNQYYKDSEDPYTFKISKNIEHNINGDVSYFKNNDEQKNYDSKN